MRFFSFSRILFCFCREIAGCVRAFNVLMRAKLVRLCVSSIMIMFLFYKFVISISFC